MGAAVFVPPPVTRRTTAQRTAQAWPAGTLILDTQLLTAWAGDGATAGGQQVGGGGVTTVAGRTGAVVLTAADVAGLGTAATRPAGDFLTPTGSGAGLTNLSASALASGSVSAGLLPVFGASGPAHAAGAVPDPGAAAGSTRYLREDQTWASPGGGVTTVAGRAGAVTLTTADVGGLGADLALKAPLASPALSGTPTAPTAAAGTNTAQVATTAFVLANLPAVPVTTVAGRTGAITLTTADVGGLGAAATHAAGDFLPAGSAKQLQYNNAGAWGGTNVTYDPAYGGLTVPGSFQVKGNAFSSFTGPGSELYFNTGLNVGGFVCHDRTSNTPLGFSTDSSFFQIKCSGTPVLNITSAGIAVNKTTESFGLLDVHGGDLCFSRASSTTTRSAARVGQEWATSTDATRKGRLLLLASDFSGTDREGVRVESSGAAPLLGFFGATAAAQPSGDVVTALGTLGLVTSPTILGGAWAWDGTDSLRGTAPGLILRQRANLLAYPLTNPYSLSFAGSGSVTCGTGALAAGAFTLSLWFQTSSAATMVLGELLLDGAGLLLYLSGGTLYAGFRGGTQVSHGSGFHDGAWHCLVFQFLGGAHGAANYALGIDGTSRVLTDAGPIGGSSATNYWGQQTSGSFWNGLLKSMQIFPGVLSGADLAALAAGGVPAVVPLHHWTCNEGAGTALADTGTPGGAGGTLNSCTWSAAVPAANPDGMVRADVAVWKVVASPTAGELGVQEFGDAGGATALRGGRLGFFAATPAVRQTGGAATAGATYTSAEQTMINAIYTALRNYGLLT